MRRMAAWAKDLLDPATAGVAAMRLEGLGTTAVDSLKEGLKSSNRPGPLLQRRGAGVSERYSRRRTFWAKPPSHSRKFRAYALAALAALDQPASHLKLRKLMDEPSIEVRYGAFNALRTLDPTDPFLGLVRVLDAAQSR